MGAAALFLCRLVAATLSATLSATLTATLTDTLTDDTLADYVTNTKSHAESDNSIAYSESDDSFAYPECNNYTKACTLHSGFSWTNAAGRYFRVFWYIYR